MEWLNISLEIAQRTGVELGEDAIARIRNVRDLLAEIAGGVRTGGSGRDLLEEPEAALGRGAKALARAARSTVARRRAGPLLAQQRHDARLSSG